MNDYHLHPASMIFPDMAEKDFQLLVESIKIHGQLEPVWIYEGQVIDGRHRQKACKLLKIDVITKEWEGNGDLVSFVTGLNVGRRHLTPTQRAVAGLKALAMVEDEAKKRQIRKPADDSVVEILPPQNAGMKSRDLVADMVGVSGKYISEAKAIANTAPEMMKAMESGQLTLQEAKKQIKAEKSVKAVEPIKEIKKEMVINEEMPVQAEVAVDVSQFSSASSIGEDVISRLSKIGSDDINIIAVLNRVIDWCKVRIESIPSLQVKEAVEMVPEEKKDMKQAEKTTIIRERNKTAPVKNEELHPSKPMNAKKAAEEQVREILGAENMDKIIIM